ncbi:hypothetical protein MHYP_G00168750 [Metynnis hypsauchen]
MDQIQLHESSMKREPGQLFCHHSRAEYPQPSGHRGHALLERLGTMSRTVPGPEPGGCPAPETCGTKRADTQTLGSKRPLLKLLRGAAARNSVLWGNEAGSAFSFSRPKAARLPRRLALTRFAALPSASHVEGIVIVTGGVWSYKPDVAEEQTPTASRLTRLTAAETTGTWNSFLFIENSSFSRGVELISDASVLTLNCRNKNKRVRRDETGRLLLGRAQHSGLLMERVSEPWRLQ